MAEIEPRGWLFPRLEALVADAAKVGIARDMTVALVTDLINGPPFNVGPPPVADEDWNKDFGETDAMVNQDTTGDITPIGDPIAGVGLLTPQGDHTPGRGGF